MPVSNVKSYLDTVKLARLVPLKRQTERKSLRTLGKVIKLSASTLSRIERMESVPDFDIVMTLREWLDVPLSTLLTDGSEPSHSSAETLKIERIRAKARELFDIINAI